MHVVALTGGIGSGKTAASHCFAELGVPVIDLDVISHALTAAGAPLVATITKAFGKTYATDDGALDRQKVRELIFNSAAAREQLNAILHPAIHDEAIKQIQRFSGEPYILLSIPLLTADSPYLAVIDRTLVIDCDESTQIARVRSRSQLSATEIKKIIDTQPPRETRLAMADDVIQNNGDIGELHEKVQKIHRKYIKTCIVSKTIS